jgi:hypothetical protein
MAYAGARGATEQQMAAALGFEYPQAGLHATMEALNDTLMSRGTGLEPEEFRLGIVNGSWGASYWPYRTDDLNVLAAHYGAGLQLLDFGGHPGESLQAINQWVAEHRGCRTCCPTAASPQIPSSWHCLVQAAWIPSSILCHPGEGFTMLDGTSISANDEGERVPYMQTELRRGAAVSGMMCPCA